MAYKGLRDWMDELEKAGLLKHVTAQVDWDLELSGISRRVVDEEGPALLFENIKDYNKTPCNRFFFNGLGTREREAMALQLPRNTPYRGIVKNMKDRLGRFVDPKKVTSAPVKKNILKGDKINLFDFPVPPRNE